MAVDRALDRDHAGPLWLKDPRIARLVMETIVAGELERRFYKLRAWVPNRVHLRILPKVAVPAIAPWLKGLTARRASQLLGRTGQPFWQTESCGRWVRNRKELDRIIAKPPAPPYSHLPSSGHEI